MVTIKILLLVSIFMHLSLADNPSENVIKEVTTKRMVRKPLYSKNLGFFHVLPPPDEYIVRHCRVQSGVKYEKTQTAGNEVILKHNELSPELNTIQDDVVEFYKNSYLENRKNVCWDFSAIFNLFFIKLCIFTLLCLVLVAYFVVLRLLNHFKRKKPKKSVRARKAQKSKEKKEKKESKNNFQTKKPLESSKFNWFSTWKSKIFNTPYQISKNKNQKKKYK